MTLVRDLGKEELVSYPWRIVLFGVFLIAGLGAVIYKFGRWVANLSYDVKL